MRLLEKQEVFEMFSEDMINKIREDIIKAHHSINKKIKKGRCYVISLIYDSESHNGEKLYIFANIYEIKRRRMEVDFYLGQEIDDDYLDEVNRIQNTHKAKIDWHI